MYKLQTKVFTVYLMILGDCDNKFVFINALIRIYNIIIIIIIINAGI